MLKSRPKMDLVERVEMETATVSKVECAVEGKERVRLSQRFSGNIKSG